MLLFLLLSDEAHKAPTQCFILQWEAQDATQFISLAHSGSQAETWVDQSPGQLGMFSVPRNYSDGFVQWIKQVIGLCLTAFLQSTILGAGLMAFKDHILLGLMLSAGEAPRIAGTFGLGTTIHANIMSAVYTSQSAINTTRSIAQAAAPK